MGKITRKSTNREETSKPKQKRRKKDLDRIHSKILKAKRKLDNVGKNGNKVRQKRQGQTKICSRLLPKPTAGIYRNGAKGKDIKKVEILENLFDKARLKADALQLFNGDTPESKCTEISTQDKITKQCSNKGFMRNNLEWTPCTLEQSPVLGKKRGQNQKLCLVKKKNERNIFENLDPDKITKQNVNDESKFVQKEDIFRRRLFQNDKEQSEVTGTQTEIFDSIDITKENKVNEKKVEKRCSENSKNTSRNPFNRYMELCRIISAENFETGFLHNYQPDPGTTTIKKLRHTYAESFRQQLLREKNKQGLVHVDSSAVSEEHQACTYSNVSQASPVEFEVPKCSENHTIPTCLQKDVSQKDNKFHLVQNVELEKNNNISYYSSTSCSSHDTFAVYDTNGSVMKSCENSDNQFVKQLSDIHQLSKPLNLYFTNENNFVHQDSHKNLNYVCHPSKNNRSNKNNLYTNIDYGNSQCVDNMKHLGTMIFSNDSILSAKRHLSKDPHEKLPIPIFKNCAPNDMFRKRNDRKTNKCRNMKNVKRVPTILRRCNNVIPNKDNHSVQENGDCTEGFYKKSGTNLFNASPNNSTTKELYETEFSNMCHNFLTPSIVNVSFDRSKLLEPQIGSMKIKDSQDSQIDQFDINIHSNKLHGTNEFIPFNNSLHPQSFEASYNANTYTEKLAQQEQIASNMRKPLFHSNNYRPFNYLQHASTSNFNVESTKQFPEQTKLHMCEINNAQQEFFRKSTCDQKQNIQMDKKSRGSTCKGMLGPTDAEYIKNQNACHCNEQYIYFDSANRACKCNISQTRHFHEEAMQAMAKSKTLYDKKCYNGSTDNCVNLSNNVRNVPLEQRHNSYTYLKVTDDQHRAMLLQNVTQPIKYLAIKNDSDLKRIPIYINDGNVRIAEDVPLKIVTVMDPNTQIKAFPQEVTAQVIPLKTNGLFDEFAIRKKSNQPLIKHLDSVNTILFNSDPQSNAWYATNL